MLYGGFYEKIITIAFSVNIWSGFSSLNIDKIACLI
jgi:hypothetical protein